MGIMETISVIVTTAAAIIAYTQIRRGHMLYIQIVNSEENNGFATVWLRVFPADTNRSLSKISSNAKGLAVVDYKTLVTVPLQKYSRMVEVDMVLQPSRICLDPQELALSFALRKKQKNIVLFLFEDIGLPFSFPFGIRKIPIYTHV